MFSELKKSFPDLKIKLSSCTEEKQIKDIEKTDIESIKDDDLQKIKQEIVMLLKNKY